MIERALDQCGEVFSMEESGFDLLNRAKVCGLPVQDELGGGSG